MTRQDRAAAVRAIFPEIAQLSDPELKENVTQIWVEAWEESTWETLESIPKNTADAREFSLVQHVRAVAQGCLSYAHSLCQLHHLTVDADLLLAGALLHDVSKLVEYECVGPGQYRKSPVGTYVQHGVWGAHKAIAKGLPWPLVHLIITHTRASGMPPQTLEGVILHYVDYLDTDALLCVGNKPLMLRR